MCLTHLLSLVLQLRSTRQRHENRLYIHYKPYPLHQRRTDLGMLVVLSASQFQYIYVIFCITKFTALVYGTLVRIFGTLIFAILMLPFWQSDLARSGIKGKKNLTPPCPEVKVKKHPLPFFPFIFYHQETAFQPTFAFQLNRGRVQSQFTSKEDL